MGLARAYLGLNKLEEAENSANEALRLDPNYQSARDLLEKIKQAYYNRALSYLANLQYDEAITEFRAVLNRDSNLIDAYCKLGWAYLGRDNLRFAENSTKTAPDTADKYDIWATIMGYPEQNDLAYAEQSANEALKLDTNCQQACALWEDIKKTYYNRGFAYIEDSEYAKAIDPLLKASDIDST